MITIINPINERHSFIECLLNFARKYLITAIVYDGEVYGVRIGNYKVIVKT